MRCFACDALLKKKFFFEKKGKSFFVGKLARPVSAIVELNVLWQ